MSAQTQSDRYLLNNGDVLNKIKIFFKECTHHARPFETTQDIRGNFKDHEIVVTVHYRVKKHKTYQPEVTLSIGSDEKEFEMYCLFMRIYEMEEGDIVSLGKDCDNLGNVAQAGNYLLDFVDAIATMFKLKRVGLLDAARYQNVNLSWLRGLTKGKGWYENRGYVSEHPDERKQWTQSIQALRSTKLKTMVQAVELALEKEGPQYLHAGYSLFLELATDFMQHTTDEDFGTFIAWLARDGGGRWGDLEYLYGVVFRNGLWSDGTFPIAKPPPKLFKTYRPLEL